MPGLKELEGDGSAGHGWMARVMWEEVRKIEGSTKVTPKLCL